VAYSAEELARLEDALLDPATSPAQFDEIRRRLEILKSSKQ